MFRNRFIFAFIFILMCGTAHAATNNDVTQNNYQDQIKDLNLIAQNNCSNSGGRWNSKSNSCECYGNMEPDGHICRCKYGYEKQDLKCTKAEELEEKKKKYEKIFCWFIEK